MEFSDQIPFEFKKKKFGYQLSGLGPGMFRLIFLAKIPVKPMEGRYGTGISESKVRDPIGSSPAPDIFTTLNTGNSKLCSAKMPIKLERKPILFNNMVEPSPNVLMPYKAFCMVAILISSVDPDSSSMPFQILQPMAFENPVP
ncbi:MAG: hypothetical protein K9J45_08290 [Bacteroidales bacterium]|nr:hypothetical protein [Bacteroidales bacterium]